MKAVVVQSPKTLIVQDIPEPVVGRYDALCDMLAAGVCAGTDSHIVEGTHFDGVKYPTVLGHEGIGHVVSVGEKVKNIKNGDIVTRVLNKLPENSGLSLCHGAFAERGIVKDWQAMRNDGLSEQEWQPFTINRVLPKDFDPIESVMIITWRETLAFLQRLGLKPHSKILIVGTGGNALSFVEHARNAGHTTVVVGNTERKELFETVGTQVMISYKEGGLVSKIKDAGFRSFDVIIDAIGSKNSIGKLLPLLKPEGKVGVYGLNEYHNYDIKDGETKGGVTYFDGTIYDEGSAHDAVIKSIEKGNLNAWHYLSKEHIYPLEKIHDALLASTERKVIKSVITFT